MICVDFPLIKEQARGKHHVMKLILLNGLITGITIERTLMLIINKK